VLWPVFCSRVSANMRSVGVTFGLKGDEGALICVLFTCFSKHEIYWGNIWPEKE
jgi:hypothetical protein